MFHYPRRRFGNLQLLGDFGVGIPLRPQFYHLPGPGIHFPKGLPHPFQSAPGVGDFGQGILPQASLQHGFGVIQTDGVPPFAQAFQPDVAGNAEDPGFYRAISPESRQPPQRTQEGFAEQVLGFGRIAGQVAQVAVKVGAVQRVQRFQFRQLHGRVRLLSVGFQAPYILSVTKGAPMLHPFAKKFPGQQVREFVFYRIQFRTSSNASIPTLHTVNQTR